MYEHFKCHFVHACDVVAQTLTVYMQVSTTAGSGTRPGKQRAR